MSAYCGKADSYTAFGRCWERYPPSDPSNESRATVFPAAPVNLVATPVSIKQINLSWTNASATATDFSVERRGPGGAFQPIGGVRDATTYSDSDPSLVEGTPYQYRVFAIVAQDRGGVENSEPRDVISAASARAPATIAFTAFDISSTPGEGNVVFGALTGADAFANPTTVQAGVPDRTTGYQNTALNTLVLVEIIEVL
jgi:hypothetical protein